jgi:hypothetical protein
MEKHKAILISLAIFLLVLIISFSMISTDVGNPKEDVLTSYVVKSSLEGDFPSLEQGSFVYIGNVNKEVTKAGEDLDYLVLFYSRKIPGLMMRYNLQDKTIEAGLPVIKSPPIDLLDNKSYKITYAFYENGMQRVLINCKELISSPYTGSNNNILTGFIVHDYPEFKEIKSDAEINFYEEIVLT